MTISAEYERYLSHFKETVTLRDFNRQANVASLCALRHDVDHDLDLALEMAHKEHQLGFKATYFILPSAPYWQADTSLLDKCLQLQDYGHEVGLHVNNMAEWASGVTDDIKASLTQQLDLLRNGGVELTGIAAHGDKLCYEHNLSNYWCFEELRPTDPYTAENGRTAEGPYEADMRPRLLYPADHIARRPDGRTFELWSINMHSLGLDYHAWHTSFDQYFSDSTGGWKRTPDPMQSERKNERWQVLIHPEHWRGPKKYYFFLSSARSGSKWLSEVLSEATPLKTRHEYLLNQSFHRSETTRKATTDVWALEDNPDEVTASLAEAWEEFENQPRDFAEVNVYLEGFVSKLKAIFPEAIFVELKRDPALVVSSLMDRNWYDTPEDRRHPRLQKVKSNSIGQFERVCHYVAQVESRLRQACTYHLDLDELTKSQVSLRSQIEKLGIPFHPRLGNSFVGRVANARKEKSFPDPVDWDEKQKRTLKEILSGSIVDNPTNEFSKISARSNPLRIEKIKQWLGTKVFGNDVDGYKLGSRNSPKIAAKFCSLTYDSNESCWIVAPDASEKNAYVSIGGSFWRMALILPFRSTGWRTRSSQYIKGSTLIEVPSGVNLTIYAMSYNQQGTNVYKRSLGVIDMTHPTLEFAFTPHPNASTIDFIVYIPTKSKSSPFKLKSFTFEWVNTAI